MPAAVKNAGLVTDSRFVQAAGPRDDTGPRAGFSVCLTQVCNFASQSSVARGGECVAGEWRPVEAGLGLAKTHG